MKTATRFARRHADQEICSWRSELDTLVFLYATAHDEAQRTKRQDDLQASIDAAHELLKHARSGNK